MWLKKGLENIEHNIKLEIPFELKELFNGFDWEHLTRGEKTSFGRYFSSTVDDGKIPNIQKISKAKNNHTRYIKIKEKNYINKGAK